MTQHYDVIIVGAGPAGIFAALEISAKKSDLRVLILEKGRDINQRNCLSREKGGSCFNCNPCSTVCGWGGAGAFSDGKLTLSSEIGGSLDQYLGEEKLNEMIKEVDQTYLQFGAPKHVYGVEHQDEIHEFQRQAIIANLKLVPVAIRHLGTGRCQEILKNMYEYLINKNIEVRTQVAVEQIITEKSFVKGIRTADGEEFTSDYVILAPGREGSEWLAQEANRLELQTGNNPVDIGVRVEVPAAIMEQLTRVFYESKLIYYSQTFDDRVRTFCMNPNGQVVIENNDGLLTVNGHSHAFNKTDNTNFAVLVSKTFTEPFREPITYGKYIASLANMLGGGVIVQRLGDLLDGRRSNVDRIKKCLVLPTLKEATPGDLSLVFPYRHLVAIVEMLKALDIIAPGVYSRHTLLYGVEVKFYSSRLALSNSLETRIKNLFAAGDGAGVTRGLAQASVAGMVAAREILSRL
ncbi:soluble pyridine nucleotide transhydrogenase [Sporotomaculum syntrophicum]|uniref:Soluble pyridine nucleotide transhydrogenase n=1 Tax=Sporotomaculum syntrophicum TaxID=182264 RepID=A0A9D2WR58_9FIRM|nr:NAD(P)/FAD-dependent oxidoreductase [Sporotomaculum syntrophicum]KAF1085929.1 soluble pyridine nucleotide transhydrogenase [Sporotomaculum syntrophicum]